MFRSTHANQASTTERVRAYRANCCIPRRITAEADAAFATKHRTLIPTRTIFLYMEDRRTKKAAMEFHESAYATCEPVSHRVLRGLTGTATYEFATSLSERNVAGLSVYRSCVVWCDACNVIPRYVRGLPNPRSLRYPGVCSVTDLTRC